MASEAISSSIMIIGAAVGAAVLIAAILPAIFSAGDTFGTVAYTAEKKLKTDFQIVNTYAKPSTSTATIWMKNIGAERISVFDLQNSDVFFGLDNSVFLCPYDAGAGANTFTYALSGGADGYWDIGETVGITVTLADTISDGAQIYYTFALPNSVRRTTSFTTTQF